MARQEGRGKGSQVSLWLLTIIGILATAVGILLQVTSKTAAQQVVAGTFTAVGGGIIGATMSIYISTSGNEDTLREVRDLIASSMQARLTSDESALDIVRQKWNFYHQTRRDGKFLWRHTDYAFDQSGAVGSVSTVIRDLARNGLHRFRAEAAIRGTALVIIAEGIDGAGDSSVLVVPGFTAGYHTIRAGVALLTTWDDTKLVSKCLASLYPLIDILENGDIAQEQGSKLDGLWEEYFGTKYQILPLVTDLPQP